MEWWQVLLLVVGIFIGSVIVSLFIAAFIREGKRRG